MISMYDLTPYEFILLVMHVISGMLYTALGIEIIKLKKYLKWNRHIYPRMMIASFGLAIVFFSSLVSREEYNIFFHLFMWLFAFNQFSELFRLVEKFNNIQELEKKLNMKNHLLILGGVMLMLTSCGSRKVELEKQIEINKSKTEAYDKTISDLNTKISSSEESTKKLSEEVSVKNSEIQKLKTERKELQEKINEEKQDDISIKNASGNVKVTDANGNTYEIPSVQGTEISKTSVTKLQSEKKSLEERLDRSLQIERNFVKTILQQDNTIKKLTSEIEAKKEEVSKLNETIEKNKKAVIKNTDRKAYPVWLWLLVGAIVGSLLLEFIKKQNPFNIFKKLKQ